ncbi:MAG: hypothetical protein Kow0069_15010 [Promethearchaeota archaeon]
MIRADYPAQPAQPARGVHAPGAVAGWRPGWLVAGFALVAAGVATIQLQVLLKWTFLVDLSANDVVPSEPPLALEERLLFALVPSVGSPSAAAFLFLAWRSCGPGGFGKRGSEVRNRVVALALFFSYALVTLAAIASFTLGGGWFVGAAAAVLGSCVVALGAAKSAVRGGLRSSRRVEPRAAASLALLAFSVAVLPAAFVPRALAVASVPPPLVEAATEPPAGVAPNWSNTFYVMPIWEWQGDDYEYGAAQLGYMKAVLGGSDYSGDGFVKIGRSVSCWYTNNIFENGSFDPTHLLEKLELSARTDTPILFHLNGGNWGQCCSNASVIWEMRNNASNCQWDQRDDCHPVKFNPGPNDRFWSLWPGSDWERFRERNLKQALAVVRQWWQEHPDLLVGFSLDSEVHLNYKDFSDVNPGGYRSWFDYNPGTIEQFRGWAREEFGTLEAFNRHCGTSFGEWSEVDGPRSDDVVGVAGHPYWETWTEFRVWHVGEAVKRQARWVVESGFPPEMVFSHQILSEPGSESARYRRCDPLETAVNEFCVVGVTRYSWASPELWHQVATAASSGWGTGGGGEGGGLPSWGVFEWNLWHQHQYWAYRETLALAYQYGAHVVCPNEWTNQSANEGLWIPGDPCREAPVEVVNGTTFGSEDSGCAGSAENGTCVRRDEQGRCLEWVDPHGNPHLQAALRDFVAAARQYPRGTSPLVRASPELLAAWADYHEMYGMFTRDGGLVALASAWGACLVWFVVLAAAVRFVNFRERRTRR